ncbi:hypothetical protein LEMA_P120940.1 [Plenodomus lingam JN3]|uniref:Autophagy protein n=2 Tax=Leptosphaeria maculans TaxID=5022 RepID=E4ZT15_LEPMJ|nr:hypothetical protein LEMA_P120940.1 [Plenodomus lingam JN3]CBX94603.1 hypothetical protein LEMA_P120940.1 [Plenodomus lingam JN3]
MSWFWGSNSRSNGQDELDPSLRDFLKKEAPIGPKPSLPAAPSKPKHAEESPTPTEAQPQATQPQKPIVPPESQFQDGRYADLWKNYTPQHIVADRGKNEQDRLRDLIDAYNERRGAIGRIAMENCALEYMEQFECWRSPQSWWQQGTMCTAESRRFNRCYDLQTKFLKALGYMTMEERSPEDDERIQMHADKLYQQMLAQEKEMEEAKKEGRPVPKFGSLLSKENVAQAMVSSGPKSTAPTPTEPGFNLNNDIWGQIKPDVRKEYEKKLAEMQPEEREVERLAVLGELRASQGVAKQVEETFVSERIERMKRKQAGQATIGDMIKTWWGWG